MSKIVRLREVRVERDQSEVLKFLTMALRKARRDGLRSVAIFLEHPDSTSTVYVTSEDKYRLSGKLMEMSQLALGFGSFE